MLASRGTDYGFMIDLWRTSVPDSIDGRAPLLPDSCLVTLDALPAEDRLIAAGLRGGFN